MGAQIMDCRNELISIVRIVVYDEAKVMLPW
jgi:hypothetical protein